MKTEKGLFIILINYSMVKARMKRNEACEVTYYLTHPNSSTNSLSEAAIYIGAALILEEYQEDCSFGHPEDQIKCKQQK